MGATKQTHVDFETAAELASCPIEVSARVVAAEGQLKRRSGGPWSIRLVGCLWERHAQMLESPAVETASGLARELLIGTHDALSTMERSMNRLLKACLCLAVASAAMLPRPASAQVTSGSLAGTVTDES